MTARKPRPRPKKRAPIALRWLAGLRRCGDVPPANPGRTGVIAVCAVLVGYADADGRNCYPAVGTIVEEAGVSRRTARLVLAWLVDNGWLAPTAKAIPWHRPTTYRLTFPKGAEEHPYEDAYRGAEEHPFENVHRGAARGAARGDGEHPDLLPPSPTDEEGRRSGRSGGQVGEFVGTHTSSAKAPLVSVPTLNDKNSGLRRMAEARLAAGQPLDEADRRALGLD